MPTPTTGHTEAMVLTVKVRWVQQLWARDDCGPASAGKASARRLQGRETTDLDPLTL